uniref:SAP domain containing ribonucleoprotein n=1 Tax=Taeniopygia guttata TaxID=59729 RepID=A0A674H0B6_TAEGU
MDLGFLDLRIPGFGIPGVGNPWIWDSLGFGIPWIWDSWGWDSGIWEFLGFGNSWDLEFWDLEFPGFGISWDLEFPTFPTLWNSFPTIPGAFPTLKIPESQRNSQIPGKSPNSKEIPKSLGKGWIPNSPGASLNFSHFSQIFSRIQEKKVVKISSDISQMERMQKRAERFNVPVSLESKKAARAARFGLATIPTKGLAADSKPTVREFRNSQEFGGIWVEFWEEIGNSGRNSRGIWDHCGHSHSQHSRSHFLEKPPEFWEFPPLEADPKSQKIPKISKFPFSAEPGEAEGKGPEVRPQRLLPLQEERGGREAEEEEGTVWDRHRGRSRRRLRGKEAEKGGKVRDRLSCSGADSGGHCLNPSPVEDLSCQDLQFPAGISGIQGHSRNSRATPSLRYSIFLGIFLSHPSGTSETLGIFWDAPSHPVNPQDPGASLGLLPLFFPRFFPGFCIPGFFYFPGFSLGRVGCCPSSRISQ